jgi:phage shock protein A
MRTQEAARRSADAVSAASGRIGEVASNGSAFDGYADAIDELQARAEAARELADDRDDSEEQLQELEQRSEVDAELERLKSARATG